MSVCTHLNGLIALAHIVACLLHLVLNCIKRLALLLNLLRIQYMQAYASKIQTDTRETLS